MPSTSPISFFSPSTIHAEYAGPKLLIQTASLHLLLFLPWRFFVLFVCGVWRSRRRCHAEKSGQLGIIDGLGDNLFPKMWLGRPPQIPKLSGCISSHKTWDFSIMASPRLFHGPSFFLISAHSGDKKWPLSIVSTPLITVTSPLAGASLQATEIKSSSAH